MWNAILNVAGWTLFYLWILLYVRWVMLERTYFAGKDAEKGIAGGAFRDAFPESRDAHPITMFLLRPSLRRPA